jgi:hypothetical protein
MESPARRGFPGRYGSRWRSEADYAAANRRVSALWTGTKEALAEASARLLKAAGVEVVAGVPRVALVPPARPGKALAALKSLGAAQARAAEAESAEDHERRVAAVPYERIMEILSLDDD